MALFDKLIDKITPATNKIRVGPDIPSSPPPTPSDPNIVRQINVLPKPTDESSLHQAALFSAEENRLTALALDARFRQLSQELFNVTPDNWWEPGPLLGFATRYEIPIMMARVNVANYRFDRSANHWVLILNTPVHNLTEDTSKAAIYDPMRGEVGEIDLPPWELVVNDAGVICGATNQIYYNSIAARLLADASYDLKLTGDQELGQGAISAKTAPFQLTDGFRCGSICLVSALYRAGAKGLMSSHGQQRLETDTGIHVWRRSEITGVDDSPEIKVL